MLYFNSYSNPFIYFTYLLVTLRICIVGHANGNGNGNGNGIVFADPTPLVEDIE